MILIEFSMLLHYIYGLYNPLLHLLLVRHARFLRPCCVLFPLKKLLRRCVVSGDSEAVVLAAQHRLYLLHL
jgi:hypothetical protein